MSGFADHDRGTITWEHEYDWGADATTYRVGRAGGGLVAEWVGAGMLRTSPDGSVYTFFDLPGANSTYRERVRNVIVPGLIRHLRGEITLHASAIERGGAAVAMVGPSGAGKSTLASALCDVPDVSVVADDVLFVDLVGGVPFVAPTERMFRLATNVDRPLEKSLRQAERFSAERTKLLALVELVADDTPGPPSLRRELDVGAFKVINEAFTRFTADDPRVNARDFVTVSALTERVPVFVLRRSLKRGTLPTTVQLLLDLLGAGAERNQ